MSSAEIRVEVHLDLWSSFLGKLSEDGLKDLEMAILTELYRRTGDKAGEKNTPDLCNDSEVEE